METAATASAPKPALVTAPKPFITANQVTFARLALLPFGSWLIYQGVNGQWVAFFYLIVLGCTDFVDGMLARRYGGTVLGGLMDPIADKLFVVMVFLPMTDPAQGWLPPAWVGALLVREFLVTSLRTSYQRREITLRSTYVAKVKTWVQMSATAFFFLARVLPSRAWLIGVVATFAAAPVVAGLVVYAVRRRWWRGAIVFCGCFSALTLLALLVDRPTFSLVLLIGTVALTWGSAGSYFTGVGDLWRRGLDLADWARAVGAIALPVSAIALLGAGYVPAWAIITLLCLEFAVGGLDNLLVHHDAIQSGAAWGARVLGESVLLAAAFVLARGGAVPAAVASTYVAVGIAAVSASLAFWRHRRVYLTEA